MYSVEIQAGYAHFVHLIEVVDEVFNIDFWGGRSEYRWISDIDVREIGAVGWVAKRVYTVDVL
jgi:hypothetical protein